MRRARGGLTNPAARGRLVDCGRCGSDFVSPVAWHEAAVRPVRLGWGAPMTRWWIRLRCGECGDVREVEVSDAEAKRFERDLEDGAEALMAALRDT